jgi:hypothetical protein
MVYMVSAGDDKQKINSDDKLPQKQEYICEVCTERFDNTDNLYKHRSTEHNAATGV